MCELETLIWAKGGHLQKLTWVEETRGWKKHSFVDLTFVSNIGSNLEGDFLKLGEELLEWGLPRYGSML